MSTFLELCQAVARESGTVSGTLPSAVTSQTGRLGKIVFWTNEAWRRIQTSRATWEWMRREFSSTEIEEGTAKYLPSALGITSFATWVRDGVTPEGRLYFPFSLYVTATGVSDEGPIKEISWHQWRMSYGRGSQDANRPTVYAISPLNEVCLGAWPNDDFTLLGEYFKGVQDLDADDDEPELPARFHDIIKWYALTLLHEHDEGVMNIAAARFHYNEMLFDLERDQLPRLVLGGAPIA